MINQTFKLYSQNIYTMMILFSITCLSLVGCKKTNEIELKTAPVGGDFTLQSNTGNYSLTQSRGKLVLIYFGFTSCPDVCPTTLSNIAQAFKGLDSKELKKVQTLFISIDPERDKLDRLQEYSAFFHPQILALTGSQEELQRVAALYGAYFRKEKVSSNMEYTMDHTSTVFVVNQDGKWVDSILHGSSPSDFKKTIHKYVK
jgi:protein SCO1/2